MGREGRVITRRQKGKAFSGLGAAHERGKDALLEGEVTFAKGEWSWVIRQRKTPERQILRKTWCRDDGACRQATYV